MKGVGKIKIKSPIQPEPKTEQIVDSDQPEEVVPNEQTNGPDNTIGENDSIGKGKILKRVWTSFFQRPIATITCVAMLLGGVGTLFMGINAIRSNNSNLSLSGESILTFIEAVKSHETSQIEKSLERIEGNPKVSILDKAIVEAYRLQLVPRQFYVDS